MLYCPGCASARQLQQAGGQQGSVDIGGLVNQIGQVASQGIQSVLQNSNQGAQQAANSSRPLGGVGDALSNLGAQLNNRTTAASPNRGTAAGPAPAPKPDDGLLADATEIAATSNTTSGTKGGTSAGQGGLAGMLGNLTGGLANVTSGRQQQGQPTIQPPPGMGAKSAAGAVVSSSLAGFAAFVVLLLQLLA